ncbi:hypothetical protein ACIBHX_04980 [Nonomuraea sp. NPDC050536]|uniref:hypothetical protein n=1 Tax=Nonomuraea sp. NPDC050536 TaxID=3364366 RepID=UPI0037CCBD0C
MTEPGYSVRWESLRRESSVLRERHGDAERAQEELKAAFDRDRGALGGDPYGAELAKKLPGIERGIFEAFDAYLKDLDDSGENLRKGSAGYEAAE